GGALARRLYSSNPFYVLGACLLFAGLRLSFDTEANAYPSERLLLGLGVFTTLTAALGFLLIRWGQVWDDVRSLLLLVLLLIVGMSVTLDQIVATDLAYGATLTTLLWLYTLAIVALLTRGLGMRLALAYTAPLIAILTAIIGYSLVLKWLLDARHLGLAKLGLAMYPTLGGAIALTLLPAIRRGPTLAEPNGTPWRWPLYPWSMFVILAAEFVGRAYYLCQSFGIGGRDDHIFGLYLFAPSLLAIAALLLEETLRRRDRAAQAYVLLCSFFVVAAVFQVRDTPFGWQFWHELTELLGCSWLHMTISGLVVFHAWALIRGATGAHWSLTAALIAWAGTRPPATALFDTLYGWPLLVFAVWQAAVAVRRGQGARAFVAVIVGLWGLDVQWPGLDLGRHHGLWISHTLLIAAWFIALTFRDSSTRWVRRVGQLLVPLVAIQVWRQHAQFAPPVDQLLWYGHAPVLSTGLLLISWLHRQPGDRLSAAITSLLWLAIVGRTPLLQLRADWPGFDLIVGGTVALVTAIAISIRKGLRYRAGVIPDTPRPVVLE
ncbi:MAG: hypothetical protein JNM18_24260, partial [Planctomycetaceae bacterium]|nr:hypothetical protein [Planctomycetaceae bacterium]